jgi:membrane-bound lytic murein transglycosylase D
MPSPVLDSIGSVSVAQEWEEDQWALPEDYEPAFDRRSLPRPGTEEESIDGIIDSPWSLQTAMQERVAFWVDFWKGRGSGHFRTYLERMGRYEDLVNEGIRQRYLPPSLRYLPIVESGYAPRVSSRAGARGLWQLMAPTAQSMGLRVDALLDQRSDPVAATPVALDYLSYLRDRFDSWFLALAAYNGGPGRLSRLIQRYAPDEPLGDHLFWVLRPYLPRETREFVPKFLAAAQIARDPEEHGLAGLDPDSAIAYVEVEVEGGFPLRALARAGEIPLETLTMLNPHFSQGLTPPGSRSRLRIPAGSEERFAESYPLIPPEERRAFFEHRIQRGETLSHVAVRYGIRVADLMAANPGVNPRRLQIGQRIAVVVGAGGSPSPRAAGSSGQSGSTSSSGPSAGSSEGDTHVVRSGESLWTIARMYRVTVNDLRAWNGIAPGALLHPGDVLKVSGQQVLVYRVRRGDTLSGIAARHGVRVSDLARWNGLSLDEVIRPGDRIRLLPPGD